MLRRSIATALLLSLMGRPSAYDEQVGLMMAHLEKAVYCGKERFESWDVGDSIVHGPRVDPAAVRFVERSETKAAAGVGRMLDPQGCFVAVRGTLGDISSILDVMCWLTDFGRPSCPDCQVDFGFKSSYDSIKDDIFRALAAFDCQQRPLYLVGHSLGAAGLTYHLFDVLDAGFKVEHMYALESPRPGNPAFVDAMQAKIKGVDAWRVSHYKDIVVHMPPRLLYYQHALPEIYYTNRSGTLYRECGLEDADCSNQWRLWQQTPRDHSWYADINPCSCSNATNTPPLGADTMELIIAS